MGQVLNFDKVFNPIIHFRICHPRISFYVQDLLLENFKDTVIISGVAFYDIVSMLVTTIALFNRINGGDNAQYSILWNSRIVQVPHNV